MAAIKIANFPLTNSVTLSQLITGLCEDLLGDSRVCSADFDASQCSTMSGRLLEMTLVSFNLHTTFIQSVYQEKKRAIVR